MTNKLTPQEFVAKWRQSELKERSGYQEHFIDLCRLLGHPTPAEFDPTGETFTFEAGVSKTGGRQGWADVYRAGRFAFEYKGKHADITKAYQQLLLYKDSLNNPPLLVVCDFDTIIIHTNFTNSVKREYTLTLDDLLQPNKFNLLRDTFYEPERLRAPETTAEVTQQAAERFAQLSDLMRKWGIEAHGAAHFLIRVLFCLFAEDAGLLPGKVFSDLVEGGRLKPKLFTAQLRQLFGAMASGGAFGRDFILRFNGGLFDNDEAIELDSQALNILREVSKLDWASIEPSIFGTLFERSLDPTKRAQLGAHYTSRDDILLIVEPVIMAPLRRRWAEVQEAAQAFVSQRERARGGKGREKWDKQLSNLLTGFAGELASVRVLDPACGSGNFLYVGLRLLLDLEKQVITLAGDLGLTRFFPSVSPSQLYGIEINPYAHELAQITVWIGYIQWLRENGFGYPAEPILKPLTNIGNIDAIMTQDANGNSTEPEWPEAEVIVGNPPFLGDKKMRAELGDKYVGKLRDLYEGRMPGQSDLVCYWFEKSRVMIETGRAKRAGLLATNSIRNGANRTTLERIKETGDIFWAISDRDWILEGAAVNVSMIAFDNGTEKQRFLDGQTVLAITSDLSSSVDMTQVRPLPENGGMCFLGMMKAGPFDITSELAASMLIAPININGRPNSDVVHPRLGGQDVTGRPSNSWIIDFGVDTIEPAAAYYKQPFEYVRKHVKPIRDTNRRPRLKTKWWLFGETRPGLRSKISKLHRCIVTPEVAKHRIFIWMDTKTTPDHTLHVIARDDDYFIGVVQSRPHLLWALKLGSTLEDRPRYSSSRVFTTFPFPWPSGQEPKGNFHVKAIAEAARELVAWRDAWLNPLGVTEAQLKKQTLTNLYNQMPDELKALHATLDAAVFGAYGWPDNLSDDEILARLLALNLERAEAGGAASGEVEKESAEDT